MPTKIPLVRAGDVEFGGADIVVIAGPCAVESESQLIRTAAAVRAAGARLLRGGAFKPRTSPYSFQGLREAGLDLLARARAVTGLPIVTEVMDARHLPAVMPLNLVLVGFSRAIACIALVRSCSIAGISSSLVNREKTE